MHGHPCYKHIVLKKEVQYANTEIQADDLAA